MAGVEIEISLEEKKAVQALTSLIKKIDDTGDAAEKSFGGASKAFDVFKGVLGAEVVLKGFELAIDGAKELINLLAVDGVKAAAAEEQALKRLETALKLAGNNAKQARGLFADFANQIEETTGFSDDLVLSNLALLQSLAPLSDKGLKEATEAATNLASALGVDLETATRAVGAAANGQLSALQRLTKTTFKEGADNAETFANALEKLNTKFGGAAVQNFQTFDGAIKALDNSFEDFIKSFGRIIVENEAVKSAIRLVADTFKDLEGFIDSNKKAIEEFINGAVRVLVDVFKSVVQVVKDVANFFSQNQKEFQAYAEAAGIVVNAVIEIIDALGGFKTIAIAAAAGFAILNAALLLNPFVLIAASVAALVVGVKLLKENFNLIIGTVQGFAASVVDFMLPAISAVLDGVAAVAGIFNKDLANSIKNAKAQIASYSAELKKSSEENIAIHELQKEASNQEAETVVVAEKKKQVARAESTKLLNDDLNARLSLEALFKEALLTQDADFAKVQADINSAQDQTKFQTLIDNLGREETLRALSQAKKLEAEGKHQEALKVLRETNKKAAEKDLQSLFDFEKNTNAGRAANFKSTLSTIATLSSSNNDTLFAIGKAAAIGTATIDGIAAVQKALASAPPPFNFALAALVGIATAANIAKIASAQPPGRAAGGFVPGPASPSDNTLINAASGELILNRRQQTDLFNAINQNDLGTGGGVSIVIQGNVMADDDSQVQKLITRINDNIQFRNASLAT